MHVDGGGVALAGGHVCGQVVQAAAGLHGLAADVLEVRVMLAPGLDAGVHDHPAPVEVGAHLDRVGRLGGGAGDLAGIAAGGVGGGQGVGI